MKTITVSEAEQLIKMYPEKESLINCKNRFFIASFFGVLATEKNLTELWEQCKSKQQ